MLTHLKVSDFTPEQQELWQRVNDLWAMSKSGNVPEITAALHPCYVGWDMNSALPHDRETAVRSASGSWPALAEYALQPLSVEVYDDTVKVHEFGLESYQPTLQCMPGHVGIFLPAFLQLAE